MQIPQACIYDIRLNSHWVACYKFHTTVSLPEFPTDYNSFSLPCNLSFLLSYIILQPISLLQIASNFWKAPLLDWLKLQGTAGKMEGRVPENISHCLGHSGARSGGGRSHAHKAPHVTSVNGLTWNMWGLPMVGLNFDTSPHSLGIACEQHPPEWWRSGIVHCC